MNSQWTPPKMIELTLEEAIELADLSIACAAQKPGGPGNQDYG